MVGYRGGDYPMMAVPGTMNVTHGLEQLGALVVALAPQLTMINGVARDTWLDGYNGETGCITMGIPNYASRGFSLCVLLLKLLCCMYVIATCA